jgi:hydroxyacylglutathione hydrolase
MYFKQFLDDRVGCASYLIASRQTHEAAIIDPAIETEQYEAMLRERGFRLRYLIDTHVHADHVSGARKLAARVDDGPAICLHESAQVTYPFRGLHDGEELPLGQLRLRVVHTPGHRPEMLSLLVVNPDRSPEPSMVLTGDSLLVGDVGRPDFGGGDAAAQYGSVTRLLGLADWVAVFPSHFEGPCGKGMCGRPSTTIGFERRFNPIVKLDQETFIARLTGEVPARPLNITAIEATNRGLAEMPWAMLTTNMPVPEIGIEELARRSEDALVVDVREPEEYAAGHVPGAINLPQADLATRMDELPRDTPILLICQGGLRSLRAARFLAQVGFADVASVQGGTAAWQEVGWPIEMAAAIPSGQRYVETEWAHAGVTAGV